MELNIVNDGNDNGDCLWEEEHSKLTWANLGGKNEHKNTEAVLFKAKPF